MKKSEAQQRFLRHLFSKKGEEGFTLVELIVVVVIIGILSAIAVPSFNSASDKAKQKEVSVLLAAYVKAAQAYYYEYSSVPRNSSDLGNYISITGCSTRNPNKCKSESPEDLQMQGSTGWFSPSGLYQIEMSGGGSQQVTFRAFPAADGFNGYGVGACFSGQNGVSRVVEMTTKGPVDQPPNCE